MAEILDVDVDLQTQQILLAASQHDIAALRPLLRVGSANVQDPETLSTPLHAAIDACAPDEDSLPPDTHSANGRLNGYIKRTHHGEGLECAVDLEAATATVRLLLQNGAIWNDLNANNETPGCIALRLGLKEIYELMVDAGVRAEMLMSRLDEYDELPDDEGEEEDNDEATDTKEEIAPTGQPGEIVREAETSEKADINSANYLASDLKFQADKLLDSDANAVMMAWEQAIMTRTSLLLCPRGDLRILNVGFGMGIIDGLFQSHKPSAHHIIEAHPAVLANMKTNGWHEKANVVVHEGRWQDVLPRLLEANCTFDAIYFDTFAEPYSALRTFFSEYVIGLLDEGGVFSFFNGMGADRKICYDVYNKVVEFDLFEAGLETEWQDVEVGELGREGEGEWQGVRRRYWVLDTYRLPICRFLE